MQTTPLTSAMFVESVSSAIMLRQSGWSAQFHCNSTKHTNLLMTAIFPSVWLRKSLLMKWANMVRGTGGTYWVLHLTLDYQENMNMCFWGKFYKRITLSLYPWKLLTSQSNTWIEKGQRGQLRQLAYDQPCQKADSSIKPSLLGWRRKGNANNTAV
jgi:hypothetical protein